MLKLESYNGEFKNEKNEVVKYTKFYVEFPAESADKKINFKYRYDINIADKNWKELLVKNIATASVVLGERDYLKDGKTYKSYFPRIQFFMNKEKYFVDFKVEDKAVLFLFKLYCL